MAAREGPQSPSHTGVNVLVTYCCSTVACVRRGIMGGGGGGLGGGPGRGPAK